MPFVFYMGVKWLMMMNLMIYHTFVSFASLFFLVRSRAKIHILEVSRFAEFFLCCLKCRCCCAAIINESNLCTLLANICYGIAGMLLSCDFSL